MTAADEILIHELFLDSGPIMCWTEYPEDGDRVVDGMGHLVPLEDCVTVSRAQWDEYRRACAHVAMFENLFRELA
jgi:hypothetical protein